MSCEVKWRGGGPVPVLVGHSNSAGTRGLVQALRSQAGVCVLASGVAADGVEDAVRRLAPLVVVLDDGAVEYWLLARLMARWPALGVVVLVDAPALLYWTLLLSAGVVCVARTAPVAVVVDGLREAALGEPARFVRADGERLGLCAPTSCGLLSRRETEVRDHLSEGKSYAATALAMGISVDTVKTHARNVRRKLGVFGARRRHHAIRGARSR